MNLTITDYTGQLSANPALWPEELKKAVAECCCGKPGPTQPVVCCPGVMLPANLTANLKNTLGHDGGHSLRFYEDPYITGGAPSGGPPWLPTEGLYAAAANAGVFGGGPYLPSSGWYTDLIEDDCQNGAVHFEGVAPNVSGFDPNFVTSTFVLDYTYKVYYYLWFGGNYTSGFNPDGTRIWKAGCNALAIQLCYPVGTLKTVVTYLVGGEPQIFRATYNITYHDQATNGGAGGVTVPNPGVPGTFIVPGTALNNPYSISGLWRFPGAFILPPPGLGAVALNGYAGDVVCSPYKLRLLALADYKPLPTSLIGGVRNFTYGCGTILLAPHPYFDTPVFTRLSGQEVGINAPASNLETGVTDTGIGTFHTAAQIGSLPHMEIFP